MEERGGAHRVTQRHLGDPSEEPLPEEVKEPSPLPEPVPAIPLDPSPPAAAVPREPSDVELRKRQRAWRIERARFEAGRDARAAADPPPP